MRTLYRPSGHIALGLWIVGGIGLSIGAYATRFNLRHRFDLNFDTLVGLAILLGGVIFLALGAWFWGLRRLVHDPSSSVLRIVGSPSTDLPLADVVELRHVFRWRVDRGRKTGGRIYILRARTRIGAVDLARDSTPGGIERLAAMIVALPGVQLAAPGAPEEDRIQITGIVSRS